MLRKYELPTLNELVTLDLNKQLLKGLCTKAVNSYKTKSLVADIKTKKSSCYLSTHSLRVGLPHLIIWRDTEAGGQVRRSSILLYTTMTLNVLLSGDESLPHNLNVAIFDSVQKYILATKRFSSNRTR